MKFLVCLIFLITTLSIEAQEYYSLDADYHTSAINDGKLKKNPFFQTTKRYGNISVGDSIEVLGYKNENYFVRINDSTGFVYQGAYFKENQKLKKFRDSITLLEKDSIEVYRIRQDSILQLIKEIEKKECQYVSNQVDPISGKKRTYTERYKIASVRDYGLKLQFVNFEGQKVVRFYFDLDLGCTSPYKNNRSKVEVKLENGDIIKFYHSGEINCGEFALVGRITSGEIARLKKSKIVYVRLTGTDSYQDFDEIEYPDVFFDKLKCI